MTKLVYNYVMSGVQTLRLRESKAGFLAWMSTAISISIVIVSLWIAIRGALITGNYRAFITHQSIIPFVTIVYSVIGALIVSRHERNPIGWIFISVGLLYSLSALVNAVQNYSISPYQVLDMAQWLDNWLWMPTLILPITFVPLLFPDGHLPSPRWRFVAWSTIGAIAIFVLTAAFHTAPYQPLEITTNPYAIQSITKVLDILQYPAYVLVFIGFAGSLAGFVVRYRRSTSIVKDQMKWLLYAMVGMVLFGVGFSLVGWIFWPDSSIITDLGILLSILSTLGIAIAATIAILKHRLYDIDLIINRTLVYTTLTAVVIALYGLVVGALGAMFQTTGNTGLSLIATGLAAILVQPVRERLQRAVNRLMYGERDDPYAVLSGLNRQLAAALSPEDMLPNVVKTVAQAMKLPYVAISLKQDDTFETAASYGTESGETLELPLSYQGEVVGQLSLAGRSPNESFTRAEKRLLEDIARHIGVTAHTVKLTQDLRVLARDLQHSRERIISAREEERRRLRRDLHDGLGPVTASQGLKLAALQQYSQRDPQAAEKLLNQLIAQNEGIVTEIRRLVYDLRPPALDEVGLVEAIRDQVVSAGGGPGVHMPLDVRVEEPSEPLPTLPAAVEVAAYRIAMEAVTNVYRHANASSCTIRFSATAVGLADTGRAGGTPQPQKMLILEICDDGSGVPEVHKAGVGLRSMRERAEEVGGTCVIESILGRGTRVLAQFLVE